MGLRFDERFLRDVFFRGRGVIVVGPSGIRWIGSFGPRAGAERVPEGAGAAAGGEATAAPPGVVGWLWGRIKDAVAGPLGVLRQALALPADGARRGDLQYEILLAPEELRSGGRYRVSIRRAGTTEQLLVRVPPGLREGTRLRLRGKGEPGGDGTLGDLFLRVKARGS